ncbi:MAG: dicarboxylate/amino acid:cation symporter [Firmicutes bacterium]|jgi:Na+/H+-dicarboxylate symporter|nr:dicarboxylate/amino acid:cation symporter [Bacillota bacterium]
MKKLSLTSKIFIGLILGVIVGVMVNMMPESAFLSDYVVNGLFKFIGKVFISGLKMVVVPLVFVSLVCGTCSIGDPKKLTRVGSKTLIFYLLTTAVAISIALFVGNVIDPGVGLDLSSLAKKDVVIKESESLFNVLINIIPTNPIGALASGKMLQVIFFAIMTGISITFAGEKADPVRNFFIAMNEVVMNMINLVMKVAPVGVFGLVAETFSNFGFGMAQKILMYVISVLLALLIHGLITYMGSLKVLGGLSPVQFIKNFIPAMGVAFSTASSSGTLPVTIDTVEKRCGVNGEVASFTLPLGATINMDGTAIMQGVAVVFISQLYGIELGLNGFLTVILTATLATIGTAGVPSVGLITLSMVLASVNIPVEGIAFIMGIDRILDMSRTAINITGDAVCTLLVAKSEKEFDEEVYYAKNV